MHIKRKLFKLFAVLLRLALFAVLLRLALFAVLLRCHTPCTSSCLTLAFSTYSCGVIVLRCMDVSDTRAPKNALSRVDLPTDVPPSTTTGTVSGEKVGGIFLGLGQV